MGLSSLAERLTKKQWTPEIIEAYVGPFERTCVTQAADAEVRETAASGGTVTALLIHALATGTAEGCLVGRTVVKDGRARLRYSIATTPAEVLAAQGSTYVLGDFARDAVPLIEEYPGRVAVVCLPCEATLLKHHTALADKVSLVVALFCGHASRPDLVDHLTDRLAAEAGAPLTSLRFRSGHWRGTLTARFANGVVIEKPFSVFGRSQNLYYAVARKCLACGDHFGYDADLSCGDLWSAQFKSDPIKHTAVVAKTERGARALAEAEVAGAVEAADVGIGVILDGQSRIAPFHHNVTARSKAGARLGVTIPDRGQKVAWHEGLAARIVMKNAVATATPDGLARVLARPGRRHTLMLYMLKGLESLSGDTIPGTAEPAKRRFAVIAATLSGNRGAEAMLETTIGRLSERVPGARFSVYSYMPEADRRLVSNPAVTIRSATPKHLGLVLFPFSLVLGLFRLVGLGKPVVRIMPASVRDLYHSDALLDLAGVSFIDGREKFLPFNLLTIWPAMLLGVPVFKLSQALGPFHSLPNRIASRALWHCRMVVPRGETTLAHLRDAGFPPERTFLAPDVAFGFEERDALTHEGAKEATELTVGIGAARQDGCRVFGLCPSAVIAAQVAKQQWDYVGFLAEIVAGLLRDGRAVVLFPNATRASASPALRNNDLPVIEAVLERVAGGGRHGASDAGRLLAVRGDMNAAAIRLVVRACDAVAASRFHAMVGALTDSIPVVVLGWSHKYAEVMDQFGLGEWVYDYADHDAEEFLGRCRDLLEHGPEVSATIAARLPDVLAASVAQFDEVLARLRERP